jgi:hypothetical protein
LNCLSSDAGQFQHSGKGLKAGRLGFNFGRSCITSFEGTWMFG